MTQSEQNLVSPSGTPLVEPSQPTPQELAKPQRKRGRPRKKLLPVEPSGGRKVTPLLGESGQRVRMSLRAELMRRGVAEHTLPELLQDKEIARSKKGKTGQIVVRALTGVQKSPATSLARKLENELSPSREDLIEKLQASGNTSQTMARLIQYLQDYPECGLARAIAETKADVGAVLDNYAKGALALKKLEVVLELYTKMPHLMRDLARHAIDPEVDCEVCLGIGLVSAKANGVNLNRTCPRCNGSKKVFSEASPHKAYAVGKLLEMSDFLPKKGSPMVQVNQAVQVNAGGQHDLLSRLSKAADEIIYGTPGGSASGPNVIDVEAREVQDGTNQ